MTERRGRLQQSTMHSAATTIPRMQALLSTLLFSLLFLCTPMLIAGVPTTEPSSSPFASLPTVLQVDSCTLTWVPLSRRHTHREDGAAVLCNDGSIPGYWISFATQQQTDEDSDDSAPASAAWSRGWVLYLQGGAACVDEDTCFRRTFAHAEFMTTSNVTQTIEGATMLSASVESNPFARHHRVFVHYCSSDFWLGSAPAPAYNASVAHLNDPFIQRKLRTGDQDAVDAASNAALSVGPAMAAASSLADLAGMSSSELKRMLRPIMLDEAMTDVYADLTADGLLSAEEALRLHPAADALAVGRARPLVLLLLSTRSFVTAVHDEPLAAEHMLFELPIFAGHRIVRAVLEDLMGRVAQPSATSSGAFDGYIDAWTGVQPAYALDADFVQRTGLSQFPSLADATDIVLAGSSAGAVGALNHAEYARNIVAASFLRPVDLPPPQVRVLADSGWLISYAPDAQPGGLSLLSNIGLRNYHAPPEDLPCLLADSGVSELAGTESTSCCLIAQCLAPTISSDVHVLFVQSLYDAFLLSLGASKLMGDLVPSILPPGLGQPTLSGLVQLVQLVSHYGGAYAASFQLVGTPRSESGGASNLHFFVPSCFQHVYTPAYEMDLVAGVEPLFLHVTPSSWNTVQVRNTSIAQAVTRWAQRTDRTYETRVLELTGERPPPMRLLDDCTGLQCNPTCPEQLQVPESELMRLRDRTLFESPSALRTLLVVVCVLWMLLPILAHGALWLTSLYYRRQFREHQGHDRFTLHRKAALRPLPVTKAKQHAVEIDVSEHAPLHLCFEALQFWPSVADDQRWKLCGHSVVFGGSIDDGDDASAAAATLFPHVRSANSLSTLAGASTMTAASSTPSETNSIPIEADLERQQTEVVLQRMPSMQFNDSIARLPPRIVSPPAKTVSSPARVPRAFPHRTLKVLSRPLLHSISGHFSSGQLCAVMGASGCGKSTLLELLTLRRTFGMQSGAVTLNGAPVQTTCLDWLRASMGYVSQFGSLAQPALTVRENVMYSALLRLPADMSLAAKTQRVDEVIHLCRLDKLQHLITGDESNASAGISGGQRRRLAVALELLTSPRFLVLDEPTSGLDATSALELVLVLHAYARAGNCCVLSIHQPRAEIWRLCDTVTVMHAGHIVYAGAPDDSAAALAEAIASAEGLAPAERMKLQRAAVRVSDDNANPGDFVLDALSVDGVGESMLRWYEEKQKAEELRFLRHMKQQYHAEKLSGPADAAAGDKFSSTSPASFAATVSAWREKRARDSALLPTFRRWTMRIFALESRRLVSQTAFVILFVPAVALLIGTFTPGVFFFQLDLALSLANYFVLFMLAMHQLCVTAVAASYYHALPLFYAERNVDAVTPAQHLLALFMHTNTQVVLLCVPAWIIGFVLCAAPDTLTLEGLLMQLLFATMAQRTMLQMFASTVSVFVRFFSRFEHVVLLCSACVSSAFVFSGFLIPPARMPLWCMPMQWLNPFYWSFRPLVKVRIEDLPALHNDCAGLTPFACMSREPSASRTSLAMVLKIFEVGDVDVHSYLLMLLVLQALYAFNSWLWLTAPWARTQPQEMPFDRRTMAAVERWAQEQNHTQRAHAQHDARELQRAREEAEASRQVVRPSLMQNGCELRGRPGRMSAVGTLSSACDDDLPRPSAAVLSIRRECRLPNAAADVAGTVSSADAEVAPLHSAAASSSLTFATPANSNGVCTRGASIPIPVRQADRHALQPSS